MISQDERCIKGMKVNIAVAHQMGNVEKVLNEVREDIKNGVKPRYDFIEVMACRGGCVVGGGQPCLATDEVRAARTAGLYTDDEKSTLRMSRIAYCLPLFRIDLTGLM